MIRIIIIPIWNIGVTTSGQLGQVCSKEIAYIAICQNAIPMIIFCGGGSKVQVWECAIYCYFAETPLPQITYIK